MAVMLIAIACKLRASSILGPVPILLHWIV